MHLGTGVRRYSGQMRHSSQQKSPVEVVAVLSDLVRHPEQTFWYSWNWNSALLSASLRVPIHLVVTLRQGLRAISIASGQRVGLMIGTHVSRFSLESDTEIRRLSDEAAPLSSGKG